MELDYDVPYTMTEVLEDGGTGQVYSTFCLESGEYFTPGATYTVASVGDIVYGGGTVRDDNGNYAYAGPEGDPVSDDTKFIFAAFMSDVFGAINPYFIQRTIWWLEGETNGSDSYYDYLMTTAMDSAFDASGWNIQAVNLSLNGEDSQSQLVGEFVGGGTPPAPVPEPATMLLLGTGLIGLAGIGRKKIKK